MKREIRDFLEDIVGHTENAQKLVRSTELKQLAEQFSAEGLALQRSMEIIGEAVKHIPDEIRNQYPNIPWRSVAGLRDRLSHRYWDANMQRLVVIVENNLPELKETVQQILTDLNLAQ